MPDLAFPPVGRLGLASPPSTVLCLATTTICPSRCPLLSLGHRYLVSTARCLCPLFKLVWGRSPSPDTRAVCSTGSPSSSGFARQETNGPPKFPDYPFEYMPCSQTPVVSSILALSHLGLLPSAGMTASAFPPKKTGGYSLQNIVSPVHEYTNFEAQSHGLHSCSPWLRTSVTGFTRRVRY